MQTYQININSIDSIKYIAITLRPEQIAKNSTSFVRCRVSELEGTVRSRKQNIINLTY